MLILLALAALPATAAPGDGHWDRQFAMTGTGTRNFALRFNGNTLFTGGYTLNAGNIDTNSVINTFDGTNWSVFGPVAGSSPLVVYDFGFVGSNVYVGGIFRSVGGVPAVGLARWNGKTWSAVGGFKGVALALASDGTNLYVGGAFTNIGGISNNNFAKWDGTNWSGVGGVGIGYYDNSVSYSVQTIALRNGQIYVGGSFTNAGSVAVTNFARWDGTSWSQPGGGVGVTGELVDSIQLNGTDVYAAGKFTTAGGVPALNIAKWNGSAWSPLGTGLKASPSNTPVDALAFLGPDLYASGTFTNAGGIPVNHVAKWDGAAWYSIGPINGTGVRAVSNSGSIYFCGDFNLAGNSVIGDHIVRYDGASWHGVAGKPGQGTHLFVQALALGADGLYMGGFFSAAGSTPAAGIARWDGTNWNSLNGGIGGTFNGSTPAVRALNVLNSQVFVGGAFANADGNTVNNIAIWDGFSWSPLGYGVDATVGAIANNGFTVYVGGSFLNANNSPGTGYTVNHIASWDPSSGWYPLGPGLGSNVNAICVANGRVYAGGAFTSTTGGATTLNRIGYWDGFAWGSLGTGTANGVNNTVNAILADGTDIYVGGTFTTAGGVTARGIAKWNGSSWSALGQGFFSSGTVTISSLAKIGSYIYAGGGFTNAGGSVVTRALARWDGAQWQSLGSGVGNDQTSPRVSALAAWNNDLFAGGIFETAGVVDSGYIARWNDQIDFTPPSVMQLSSPQMLPGNAFKFHATATVNAAYAIEYSSDLKNWTTLTTSGAAALDVTNTVPGVPLRSYRMREIP